MIVVGAAPGRFCWVDLAAGDSARARDFYAALFGWRTREQRANGGRFDLLQLAGETVGSMYQLDRAHLERGVRSHWTPYVQVEDVDEAVRRVTALGGTVLVEPLPIPGIAQVALVVDAVGAHLGLWQAATKGGARLAHG